MSQRALVRCLFPIVLLIIAVAGQASGQLVTRDWKAAGDGLLTYDSNSGLEWLDWTETAGRSYDDVAARFGAGGEFEGFRHATRDESRSLFLSLGMTLNTVAASNVSVIATWYAHNAPTLSPNSSYALTSTVQSPGNYYYVLLNRATGQHFDQNSFHSAATHSAVGQALVRSSSSGSGGVGTVVAEPMSLATWVTVGLACSAFCGWRRRRSRRTRPERL